MIVRVSKSLQNFYTWPPPLDLHQLKTASKAVAYLFCQRAIKNFKMVELSSNALEIYIANVTLPLGKP